MVRQPTPNDDLVPTAASERPGEDAREIEWQFDADDLAPVRAWLHGHRTLGGLRMEPLAGQCLRDTYLDTADWRIFLGGFALRVRRGAGARTQATLKGLHSARTDRAERREVSETLPTGRPAPDKAPGPVGTWVREAIGAASLVVLFGVETQRERFAVSLTGKAGDAAEIALDATRLVGASDGSLGHLLRVEVEVRDSPPEALVPLVEALQEACHLRPAAENKFAAGLRAAERIPPRE